MRILVINGSPKGNNSITLQSMLCLEKIQKEHSFTYFNAAPKLRALEKDPSPLLASAMDADLIIFAYPVYTFLAPYQLHRTLEILMQHRDVLRGKLGTQFSTSKHFYDVTAHRFMKENMLNLGLKVLPGLSADMEDLLSEEGRNELSSWWKMTGFRIREGLAEEREKKDENSRKEYSRRIEDIPKTGRFRISIVTNADKADDALIAMIEDFRAALPYESNVYNIKEYPFSSGCLGCMSCAQNGKCILKDGFDTYLRNEIQRTDSIVYAFRISNHFTDSSMKCYDDRQFCNGHRTVTAGTPTAYIIAGNLRDEENLRDLIEARASVGGNFLAGIATDEDVTSEAIRKTAASLSFALENGIKEPRNFFGVGGSKIFRDLIYTMRGLMKADHRFYKKHGYYKDLPQKHKKTMILMMLVGFLLSLPGADRKKGMMAEGMLLPYKKVLDSIR